jgi:hypothetical protein
MEGRTPSSAPSEASRATPAADPNDRYATPDEGVRGSTICFGTILFWRKLV